MTAPLKVPTDLLRVALSDLRYQRARTALAVIGVGLAVATLVGLWGLNAGYRAALDQSIDKLGYHVLVTAKGCPYETATLFLRGKTIPMYINAEKYAQVAADPAVEALTPLFLQAVSDRSTGKDRVFMGIDETFLPMHPSLRFQQGGWFSSPLAEEAIIGYGVAEYLGLGIGETVEVPGKGRRLEIVGILDRSGSQNDGTTFLPLGLAQQIFDKKHQLTGMGVRLRDLAMMEEFVMRMYDIESIQPIQMSKVRDTILGLIESARTFVAVVAVVALVLAVILVTNVMLMSVLERVPEFGVMRALGASRADLFVLVGLQALLVCAAGGVVGVGLALAGKALAEALARNSLQFAPEGRLITISSGIVLGAMASSIAVGVIAAIYPALRAAALRPVQAIRRQR